MFEQRKRRKAIEHAGDLTSSTGDGSVAKITGIVRILDKTLFAPASGRVSVAYSIQVIDIGPVETGGFQPDIRFHTVDACPFMIECDDGERVLVDSIFVELVDVAGERITEMSEHWDVYSSDRGLTSTNASEAAIEPGDRITVMGVVDRRVVRPGAESGFRESGAAVVLVGDFDHPVLIARA